MNQNGGGDQVSAAVFFSNTAFKPIQLLLIKFQSAQSSINAPHLQGTQV